MKALSVPVATHAATTQLERYNQRLKEAEAEAAAAKAAAKGSKKRPGSGKPTPQ